MSRRVYLETSALLRALLEGDASLPSALEGATIVTSALTFLEAFRAVRRARREGRIDAAAARQLERALGALERSCEIVSLDDDVLRRARESFPVEPVRSLDAIHLASMLAIDSELGHLEIATRGERVRRNAKALGLPVLP